MSQHALDEQKSATPPVLRTGSGGFVLVGDVAGNGPPVEFPQLLQGRTFIANFEGVPAAIADRHAPAPKCGPHLVTEHVRLSEPTVWTLANNHAADFGPDAILDLRDDLARRGDVAVGAGVDAPDARTPLILRTAAGSSVGLLAVCERQYGGATSTTAGTAEVGPWIFRSIRRLRESVDFVIVSIHCGPEDSPLPSPKQQDLYRAFIDEGADLVHGHHPHVPQGYERYGRGSIFYGLGNFLVNAEKWEDRHLSFVSIAILLDEEPSLPERFRVSHVMLEQRNRSALRTIAEDGGSHSDYFSAVCAPLQERALLESCYQEVAIRLFRDHLYSYTQTESGVTRTLQGRLRAATVRLLRKCTDSSPDRRLALLHHAFSCPTHADAIEVAAGVLSGRIPDARSVHAKAFLDSLERHG